MNARRFGGTLTLALVAAACSPIEPRELPLDVPPGCNPLAPEWDCTAPYPSDVFRVGDPPRVVLEGAARLVDLGVGELVDPLPERGVDGFPSIPAIVAAVPIDVVSAGLVFHDEAQASLLDASPTVLLDVERGERVLHFAELDPEPRGEPVQTLTIRPLVPLRGGARYVVAVRGLQRMGGVLEAPAGFRRLRDGAPIDHPSLVPLAARYDADVFGPLARHGVERASLQLAWDFTVQADEDATARLRAIRDDALTRLASTPPAFTVDEVIEAPRATIARVVRGHFEVPAYVDSAEPGAHLLPEGAATGSVDVPFVVIIPPSVAEREPGTPPARLIQYGHGFFGTTDEAESSFLGETLDRLGAVAVATEWWGLARSDLSAVLGVGVTDSFVLVDRLHQAMVNQLALTVLAQGALLDEPTIAVDGAPLYDPSRVYFYGNSHGHIAGSTFVSLSPVIDRAVLGVGGVGYGFMLLRSQAFAALLQIFTLKVPDRVDLQVLCSVAQSHFDAVDPVRFLASFRDHPLSGSPPWREVLLQYDLGDHAVPNLATELQIRSLGLPLLSPAVEPVVGVEEREGPLASAAVQFDFGVPKPRPGTYAIPPTSEGPGHDGLRTTTAAMTQIDAFFRPDGVVEATCDGVCDPE